MHGWTGRGSACVRCAWWCACTRSSVFSSFFVAAGFLCSEALWKCCKNHYDLCMLEIKSNMIIKWIGVLVLLLLQSTSCIIHQVSLTANEVRVWRCRFGNFKVHWGNQMLVWAPCARVCARVCVRRLAIWRKAYVTGWAVTHCLWWRGGGEIWRENNTFACTPASCSLWLDI